MVNLMLKPLLIIFVVSMLCTLGLIIWFLVDYKKFQSKQTVLRNRKNKPEGFKKGGVVK
ncbi:hypothetical protein F889_01561 [Acinetobacter colistiniresistens]|uniref:Uncharacterized protein n=1 Tax=Acinetobacter colistiniresistens TaxID=280145 RepID=N9QXX1_9GAMM|nr:hypothetical protein F889_01561 [Acinetobacter colistiniresistens]